VCKRQEVKLRRIEGTLSSFFENKTGLKQGDPLSPVLFNLALQKVIQSIKMVPSGINIGKEQLNVLAYADDIVLIGNNEIEIRHFFVEIEDIAIKLGLHINRGKTKYMIVEQKNSSEQSKTGQLTVKNYTFERVENFKYLGVILCEDNNYQIVVQERIKNANKAYLMLQKFFRNKNISKKN